MKKLLIFIIICLIFFSEGIFAQAGKPRFTLFPEKYLAGEETLYLEGTALPETEVIISLQKEENEIKKWRTLSNEMGEWSFSTRELVNSGRYYLAVRGEGAGFSDRRPVEISLSGFSLGSYPIAFRNLVLVLALILAGGVIFALYFMAGTWRLKAMLRKEAREARLTLLSSFEGLSKEIGEEIKSFDLQPGFNPREKEVYEELRKMLAAARDSIEKEIRDIEEAL